MLKRKKGQSTLEYIIVFVAIVAAIMLTAWAFLGPTMNKVMNSAAGRINNAATAFGSANIQ